MMHSGMASISAKKSFGFGKYIARPLAAEGCDRWNRKYGFLYLLTHGDALRGNRRGARGFL
jgi:hypothetical protein